MNEERGRAESNKWMADSMKAQLAEREQQLQTFMAERDQVSRALAAPSCFSHASLSFNLQTRASGFFEGKRIFRGGFLVIIFQLFLQLSDAVAPRSHR